MAIRTSEKLQAMFQASRARKEKEHQQKLKARQQQYQQLCKQADRLLKQAQEDEKKKRMEQLQALTKKTPQKAQKWTVTEFYMSSNRFIEREPSDRDLYTTREQLKRIEEEDGVQYIRWDVWDRVVNETRQMLGL